MSKEKEKAMLTDPYANYGLTQTGYLNGTAQFNVELIVPQELVASIQADIVNLIQKLREYNKDLK